MKTLPREEGLTLLKTSIVPKLRYTYIFPMKTTAPDEGPTLLETSERSSSKSEV